MMILQMKYETYFEKWDHEPLKHKKKLHCIK